MEKYESIIRFIRKIYNIPEGYIPLHAPSFAGNEKKYLMECIDSTFVSSIGKYVDLFEEKIATYTNVNKAVACVNGTSALHIALKLVGVESGHEVITQPLTFIATVNAITYCGAQPVFVDVDIDTMGLSPNVLSDFLKTYGQMKKDGCYNKITKRKISACVPMHTFGFPCRIDEIVEICNNYGIAIVEDAAESIGSYYKDKHTGTFGKIGVLSFNGNKTITTGGGGMLLFFDEELAKKAKHLTTQAKIPHAWEFDHDEIGYNYRMPNINAALGIAQLEQLNLFLVQKRKLADKYKIFFENTEFKFVSEIRNAKANYWLNTILLKNLKERNEFLKYSNGVNVMTRPAWKLMNKLDMFKNSLTSKLDNSQWLEERIINIPSNLVL